MGRYRAVLNTFTEKVVGGARHLPDLAAFHLAGRRVTDSAAHLRAATVWLLRAQAMTEGGGFAHSFHFARGWLPAYPETTGYIVPTLRLAARQLDMPQAAEAADRAWQWLLRTQGEDGSFADLSGRSQVFDTGQILIGANHELAAGSPGAESLVRRSCEWLMSVQAADGSFVRHAYNGRPHTYYSRVGAALLHAGQLLGSPSVTAAGMRNLGWVLDQGCEDGWFRHMSFADHAPFSHTIIYTLEGLLAGHRLSGDERMLQAVIDCAQGLSKAVAGHGGLLRSQYTEGFLPQRAEICVTGLSQWSALCFRLAGLGHDAFACDAALALAGAKRLQLFSTNPNLHGALPGSFPLSGAYMRYALPNWGVKFFMDALIESSGMDTSALI